MARNDIMVNLKLVKGWESKPMFSPLLSSVVHKADESQRHFGPAVRDKYVLEGRVGIAFWANPAELEREVSRAEEIFALRMYGDIVALAHEIMNAVSDGDEGRAIEICGMILDYTKGER